ncbi:MAG: ATP-binding protein [Desulfobaccales bacterium]
MNAQSPRGAISMPVVLGLIIAGAVLFAGVFFYVFHQLNIKVETVIRNQFNQQQLVLARKIADSVENHLDFLESSLLTMSRMGDSLALEPDSPGFHRYLTTRLNDLLPLGVLDLAWYGVDGVLKFSWRGQPEEGALIRLEPSTLAWAREPASKGRLRLEKTRPGSYPPFQERLILPLAAPLYFQDQFYGVLVLLADPFFICGQATKEVRSGTTGYPWIINQDGIFLAHYEKDFVGQDAIAVRLARNPAISFKGIREMHERIFRGEEGATEYISGWHRQEIGQVLKLAAFTTIRFDKGLIRNVTDVEDPQRNLWGVAVVAPVAEVSGHVWEVLYQEIALAGVFFLMLVVGSGVLIGVALTYNRSLSREVEQKTQELKESQERLLRSERFAAVGEAASYVSHEIKNPLMVIGGLAHQVAKRLEDRPELQEKLRLIREEVRRLETFLGDLRDFTRPAQPVMTQVNLNQVIQEVEKLLETEAKKRGIEIVEDLDSRLPPVSADPNQMKQVLLNLMKNALEAMDGGGRLVLKSGAEEEKVWFSVTDTGVGMSPEVLAKIFNPFFTTKDKGTGLGLAVIHKIITDHHGSILVESTPGQGSTFVVKLPKEQ